MQARAHGQHPDALSGFVRAFAGTNRFILDYLVQEVLDQQTDQIQGFLLQTSILDRLSAPLCSAVTGIEDCQPLLDALERDNLFLVPLDDQRRWYRYHHLFADLLRSRFTRHQPDAPSALHVRASAWFEERGLIVDAVNHALRAGDVEGVARLVAGNALAIMGHGELAVLARWLDRFQPAAQSDARPRPWLCVAHAWVLAYVGQLDAAEAQLGVVETMWAKSAPGPREREPQIEGHITAIHAYIAGLCGEIPRASELAREAMRLLPASDLTARGFAASLLGSTLRWSGELEAAESMSAQAIAISQSVGRNRVAADAFCDMAALQIARGQLSQARETCRDALRRADEIEQQEGRKLPVTGFVHARMSAVLCEWDRVEEALVHARQGVDLFEAWGWADGLVFGYEHLARALQASGDLEGAAEAIAKGRRIASQVSPWLASHVATYQVSIWLAQNKLELAERWAAEEGLDPGDEITYLSAEWYIALGRILLARGQRRDGIDPTGDLEQGVEVLDRVLHVVRRAGAIGHVIELLVDLAVAHQVRGDKVRAKESLTRALVIAEPEGYVRTFTGTPLRDRLSEIATGEQGTAAAYARRLLGISAPQEVVSAPATSTQDELVEPLSKRELEVLRLLNTYMTGTEIAGQLFISVHTVHSHIKNIYAKLNVHTRAEAVQRAEELGLIRPGGNS